MPFDIATGTYTEATALQPLDASGLPGVAPPTAIVPGQLSGPTYPAMDTTAMFQQQMAAGEADVRAAQSAGMAAEHDRRAHYGADILPAGAAYGDTMTLDGGSLDPGAGGGETLPAGWFYDPPRLGAPETYTAAGNEPPGTMPG